LLFNKNSGSVNVVLTGNLLASLETANQICVAEFGSGWRIAEHTDGFYDYTKGADAQPFGVAWFNAQKTSGGWGAWAFGNLDCNSNI
jgi:hypothetical protein